MIEVTIKFKLSDKDYATLMNSSNSDITFEMLSNTCRAIATKFAKGQRKHGGDFWAKPIKHQDLNDELLDLIVYRHKEMRGLSVLRGKQNKK